MKNDNLDFSKIFLKGPGGMLVIHFINVLQNVKMLNRRSDCLQQFHCSKGQTYGYRTEKEQVFPCFFHED